MEQRPVISANHGRNVIFRVSLESLGSINVNKYGGFWNYTVFAKHVNVFMDLEALSSRILNSSGAVHFILTAI
jgi:hypothetical protein